MKKPNRKQLFSPETQLRFGKYSGKELASVIELDPDYILWCLENIPWFALDSSADDLLQARQDPRRPADRDR